MTIILFIGTKNAIKLGFYRLGGKMEYFRGKQRSFILIMRVFRIKLAIIKYFASIKKRLRKNERN